VTNTFRILSKAFSDAVDLGYLPSNPAATRAAKPRVRVARVGSKVEAWSEDQLHSFLEATSQSHYWPAWFLAAHTGMRRGELLGLRWKDVDLDASRLHVRTTIVLAGYEQVLQEEGKTDNAARVIDLDPDTIDVLRSHRKNQAELLLALGSGRSDYVFCREDGSHLNPDSFSQAFDRAGARLQPKLPRLPIQGLRHTHATILLKAGVPVKVVSERLGHASVAFTMNQYQHVLPGMQAEAAAVFAALVRGRPK
jgi:integrase